MGIAGISRDLQSPGVEAGHLAEVASALDYIRSNYGSEIRAEELAEICDLSIYQLNRRLRAIFGITVSQLITKSRIDAASEMLSRAASLDPAPSSSSSRPIRSISLTSC